MQQIPQSSVEGINTEISLQRTQHVNEPSLSSIYSDDHQQAEQPDQFDPSDSDDDYGDQNETEYNNVLEDGSLFLVGRSSRFGRAIKINTKLLQ